MARLLWLNEVRATAEGCQPPGYGLASRSHLNLPLLSILNLAVLPPAWLAFALLTAPLGGPVDLFARPFALRFDLAGLALVLLTAVLVLPVVHELAHGLVAALCRARPVYGLGPGVAFCHFRELVTRDQYVAIVAAPLLLISIAGVAAMPATPPLLRGPLLALLVMNVAGAVGDVAVLTDVARLPRAALIADTREGFEAYLPGEAG
jgi:hypothetical protein